MNPEIQDQPRQHSESKNKIKQKVGILFFQEHDSIGK